MLESNIFSFVRRCHCYGSLASSIYGRNSKGAAPGLIERYAFGYHWCLSRFNQNSVLRYAFLCFAILRLTIFSLSRPSLAEQYPLPLENPNSTASLAYPSEDSDHVFSLSPAVRSTQHGRASRLIVTAHTSASFWFDSCW